MPLRATLRHPHTGRPLLPLGYRDDGRPILPILGAGPEEDDDFEPDPGQGDDGKAGTDDDEDDEDDRRDSDDEDEDDEDDRPKKPDGTPYTQADIDALTRSLRAARRDRRKGAKDGGEDGGEPDEAKVTAKAEELAAKTWKPVIVRSSARAALATAGLIGKPDRLIRLIDMEDIDVDPETGEIDGLDEQVADLRKEYPHLFRRRGTRNLDAARGRDGDGRDRSKMSATELQAAQLRGEL